MLAYRTVVVAVAAGEMGTLTDGERIDAMPKPDTNVICVSIQDRCDTHWFTLFPNVNFSLIFFLSCYYG